MDFVVLFADALQYDVQVEQSVISYTHIFLGYYVNAIPLSCESLVSKR